ncbi:unnamed protein product [Darwinula stevensoni]|uniref:Uncharacterized protein n=1 Tax=Darwinula stevensoni TaxID=69355 RepID=A0A7R8X716_9CRUS|nr:unnamed protein product [Darwinula stevensoni]CAG0881844.1 unnamed protein product [Darwinula stevensoni]
MAKFVKHLLSRSSDKSKQVKEKGDHIRRKSWESILSGSGLEDLIPVHTGVYTVLPKSQILSKLHLAAWVGDVERARKYLLKYSVDTRDSEMRTPLHLAACQGHDNMVSFLIKNGAALDLFDSCGRTPLLKAVECNHETTATWLLQSGSPVDKPDARGDTCLHYCVRIGNVSLAGLLLERGARLEQQNRDGETPLHIAIQSHQYQAIHFLLRRGHDPNAQDNHGVTPLMAASHAGMMDVVDDLKQHGADVSTKDKTGKTVADHALEDQSGELESVVDPPHETPIDHITPVPPEEKSKMGCITSEWKPGVASPNLSSWGDDDSLPLSEEEKHAALPVEMQKLLEELDSGSGDSTGPLHPGEPEVKEHGESQASEASWDDSGSLPLDSGDSNTVRGTMGRLGTLQGCEEFWEKNPVLQSSSHGGRPASADSMNSPQIVQSQSQLTDEVGPPYCEVGPGQEIPSLLHGVELKDTLGTLPKFDKFDNEKNVENHVKFALTGVALTLNEVDNLVGSAPNSIESAWSIEDDQEHISNLSYSDEFTLRPEDKLAHAVEDMPLPNESSEALHLTCSHVNESDVHFEVTKNTSGILLSPHSNSQSPTPTSWSETSSPVILQAPMQNQVPSGPEPRLIVPVPPIDVQEIPGVIDMGPASEETSSSEQNLEPLNEFVSSCIQLNSSLAEIPTDVEAERYAKVPSPPPRKNRKQRNNDSVVINNLETATQSMQTVSSSFLIHSSTQTDLQSDFEAAFQKFTEDITGVIQHLYDEKLVLPSSWLEKPELVKNLESSLSGWKEEIVALLSVYGDALQVSLSAFAKDLKDTLLCSKDGLERKEAEVEHVKEDLHLAHKENLDMSKHIASLQGFLQSKESELERRTKEVNSLHVKLEKLTEQLKLFEGGKKSGDEVILQLKQKSGSLEKEVESYKAELLELTNKMSRLVEDQQRKTSELGEADKMLELLKAQLKDANSQLEEVEQARDEAQQDIHKFKEKFQIIEQQYQVSKDKLEDASTQLWEMERTCSEAQLDALRFKEKTQLLEEQLLALKDKRGKDDEEWMKQRDNLEAQLCTTQSKIAEWDSLLLKQNEEMQELARSKACLEEELATRKNELSQLQTSAQDAERIWKELESLQKEKNTWEYERMEGEKAKASLKNVESLLKESHALQVSSEELQQENEQRLRENSLRVQEMLRSQVALLQKQIQEKDHELNAFRHERTKLLEDVRAFTPRPLPHPGEEGQSLHFKTSLSSSMTHFGQLLKDIQAKLEEMPAKKDEEEERVKGEIGEVCSHWSHELTNALSHRLSGDAIELEKEERKPSLILGKYLL